MANTNRRGEAERESWEAERESWEAERESSAGGGLGMGFGEGSGVQGFQLGRGLGVGFLFCVRIDRIKRLGTALVGQYLETNSAW